jgi:hypothetical protein
VNADEEQAPDAIEISKQLMQGLLLTSNLGQHVIMTTEDKIRLTVTEHLQRMEQRNGWVAPLGVLISIVAAFVTADFKDIVLTAAQWHALFVFAGIASFGWLCRSIWVAINAPSVEDFIAALKRKS